MTDSSTHADYLQAQGERQTLFLNTFGAPLEPQLISDSCKDVTVNIFLLLLLHKCAEVKQNPYEFKYLNWVRAPHSSFLKRSTSNDKKETGCTKSQQRSTLPNTLPKISRTSTTGRTQRQGKEGYDDKSQNGIMQSIWLEKTLKIKLSHYRTLPTLPTLVLSHALYHCISYFIIFQAICHLGVS